MFLWSPLFVCLLPCFLCFLRVLWVSSLCFIPVLSSLSSASNLYSSSGVSSLRSLLCSLCCPLYSQCLSPLSYLSSRFLSLFSLCAPYFLCFLPSVLCVFCFFRFSVFLRLLWCSPLCSLFYPVLSFVLHCVFSPLSSRCYLYVVLVFCPLCSVSLPCVFVILCCLILLKLVFSLVLFVFSLVLFVFSPLFLCSLLCSCFFYVVPACLHRFISLCLSCLRVLCSPLHYLFHPLLFCVFSLRRFCVLTTVFFVLSVVFGGEGRRARLVRFIWQIRNDEQNWIRKPFSLSRLSQKQVRSHSIFF